jgi:hypothetical protein
MARAGKKSTTVWILLSEARARAIGVLGSPEYAEGKLVEWLLARKLRWHSDHLEGSKKETDPGSGDPEFWRDELVDIPSAPDDILVVIGPVHRLIINWAESWAKRAGYKFWAIVVAESDLTKLLSGIAVDDGAVSNSTKNWVAAQIESMKVKGEFDKLKIKGITEFAKELERRRDKAGKTDKTLHHVGWGHIKNILYELGLWLRS